MNITRKESENFRGGYNGLLRGCVRSELLEMQYPEKRKKSLSLSLYFFSI
jgi:hypothetical protein